MAPQRVQILLQIVQHLMTQLLRDARGRSDDDRCTRQLASVVIVASAVTTMMRISGREDDQAAIGLGLGTTVVLARVQARLAARAAPVAGSASAAPPNRPTPQTMVGHSAADSRIIFSDLGTPTPSTPDASFASNGLVVPIAGGLVIRTGAPDTASLVTLSSIDAEPDAPHAKWEDVVEVSFSAQGDLRIGTHTTLPLPGPGDYRARVHVRRRDAGVEDGGPCGRGVRDRRLAGSAGIGTRLEGV